MPFPTASLPDREAEWEAVLAESLEALEADPPPNAESLCAHYPAFRRPLAAFLARQEQVARWTAPLRQVTGGVSARNRGSPRIGSPGNLLGQRVGPYELLAEIGRGGTGVVYRARQERPQRVVALKLFRGDPWMTADDVQRFRNEADAVAHLDHPHIVPVYEVGQWAPADDQAPLPYFTMKLLDGGSLAPKVGSGQWAVGSKEGQRRAARVLAAIAQAVHHAHQRGVLHRDLKPANILFDEEGRPYVSDFGLAKRLAVDSSLTVSGAVVGTPSYMAPEQAIGRRDRVTTATDVYGLGAVLYALLTCRPPFAADSMLETLEQVRTRPPDPPSRLNPRVDRDLETLCLKCLDKDPARRYGSAEALGQELERWLAGRPIQARAAGPMERLGRWGRRNPLVASLLLLTGFSLATTLVALVLSVVWIAAERSDALAQRDAAQTQSLLAQERTRETRQHLYVADIRLAAEALRRGELSQLREALDRQRPAPGEPDLRGFEWRYLNGRWQSTRGRPHLFRGHTDEVNSVTFSPDGRLLASASQDRSVRLWEASTQKLLATLPGHRFGVNWVSFSPDGKTLASASEDRTIRLWDVATHRERRLLEGHRDGVVGVVFSPDGRLLASGSNDGQVLFWELPSGSRVGNVQAHTKRIDGLAFSPDGRTLATANRDANARLWDVHSGKPGVSLAASMGSGLIGGSTSVAFSPDGQVLAVGQHDGVVSLYTVRDGVRRDVLVGHRGVVQSVAFTPDGLEIISAGDDGTFRIWASQAGAFKHVYRGHDDRIWCVAVSRESRIATASKDRTVKVWDTNQRPYFHRIPEAHPRHVSGLAFTSDSNTLVSMDLAGDLRLWDVKTMRQRHGPAGAEGGFQGRAVSQDGRLLAVYDRKQERILLWDLRREGVWKVLPTAARTDLALAFSPDSSRLAGGLPEDGKGWVWDAASGQVVCVLPGGLYAQPQSLAWHPLGQTLAVAYRNGHVVFWDAVTGRMLDNLAAHQHSAGATTFSPDGSLLASAGFDGAIQFWEFPGLRPRYTLPSMPGSGAIAFSPYGRTFAVALMGVRLFHVATGQELMTLPLPLAAGEVAFSPDNRLLAVGGHDTQGEIAFWSTDTDEEPREVP